MKKKINAQSKEKHPDREAVRVLAIELGVPEAARRLGLNRNTVHSWARRYKWDLPERAGRPGIVPARDLHTQPGDVLLAEHKSLGAKTKTGLATAAAKAADHAQSLDGASTFGQSNKLRDLAASAARIFGWDKKDSPQTHINQLCITAEQLEQIRQLRAVPEPERLQEKKNNEH